VVSVSLPEYHSSAVLDSHGFLFHRRYRFFLCVPCRNPVKDLHRHGSSRPGHTNLPQRVFDELKQQFQPHPDPFDLLPPWTATSHFLRSASYLFRMVLHVRSVHTVL
jgi:hypothetical protein